MAGSGKIIRIRTRMLPDLLLDTQHVFDYNWSQQIEHVLSFLHRGGTGNRYRLLRTWWLLMNNIVPTGYFFKPGCWWKNVKIFLVISRTMLSGDHGDPVQGPAAGGVRQQGLVLHSWGCQGTGTYEFLDRQTKWIPVIGAARSVPVIFYV